MDQGPTRINLNRVTDFDSIARHFASDRCDYFSLKLWFALYANRASYTNKFHNFNFVIFDPETSVNQNIERI